jgi:hypothetical protein
MNDQYQSQHSQAHYAPAQPWQAAASHRARLDKTQRFGIIAAAVSIFILGAGIGGKLQAPAEPASAVVDTAAASQAVEVTPQSCIDALNQSSAYILLSAKIYEFADKGIGGALERDAIAMQEATQGIEDTRGSMELISPLMAASSAECRAQAR